MEISEKDSRPKFYLLITSVYGKNNSGTLIRSASAFGCEKVFILGKKDKKILKKFFGSQGTVKKMKFEFFETVECLKDFCNNNSINICCVNIKYKDICFSPIQNVDFKGNTIFVLGNKTTEIPKELEEISTIKTYVDQVSKENLDLNLSICGSIAFHRFGVWAGYEEAGLNDTYNKEKYIVNKEKINSKIDHSLLV